jgi:hypothetical protein
MRYARNLKTWSDTVLERDNFVCLDCGATGCRLHAHHILEKYDFPELSLDTYNGKTVCVLCHTKYHPFMADVYGVNPDISNEFVGVYKGGTTVKVDMNRYMKLVWQGAKELMNMLRRREKKKKGYKHGKCIGNWWLKQHGYRKDMRRDIWEILIESGLLLQHKESVCLFETLIKTKDRRKKFPAFIIKQFNERAKEYYELLEEKAERVEGAEVLVKDTLRHTPKNHVVHPTFGEGTVERRVGDKIYIKFIDGQERVFNYEKAKEIGLTESLFP